MSIRVISQTTAEREQEKIDLFNKVKPYLDEGYGLSKAVQIVLNRKHARFYGQSWYKELREYVEEQGYKPQR